MLGIAVATVQVAIAEPRFHRLIASTRVNVQATELRSALLHVRKVKVSICPSAERGAPMSPCGREPDDGSEPSARSWIAIGC